MRRGDRVRCTLGETVLIGEYVRPGRVTGRPVVVIDGLESIRYADSNRHELALEGGWTVEVLPAPEPPVGTVVLDRRGLPWVKRPSGRWGNGFEACINLDALDARYGPLTLLEVAHA